MSKLQMTRRQVLGGALGTLAAGSVSAAQCFSVPQQWDETWDVIIVGSGFAGLSAA
ncbi:MAG: hypothetical protein ACI4SV_02635 [Duodenibacillus sp.]